MPANRKPKAWNLKPQMTAAPELWRGSVFCTPMWNGAGPVTNISGPVFLGSGGNDNWALSSLGRVTTWTGNSSEEFTFDLYPSLAEITQSDHTFFALVKISSEPSDAKHFFSAGDAVKWIAIQKLTTSDEFDITWDDDVTKKGLSIDANVIDEWVLIAGRRKGSTYYADVWTTDGELKVSSTENVNSSFTIGGSANRIKVGGAAWSTTQTMEDAEIALVGVNNRYLSDEIMAGIAVDPFAMLRPARNLT